MIHSILPVQIACFAIFLHNLSMSSLVYLLVWSPPPHIPYISSPNQCRLFATHAHTIATCFAVVSILYNLFLDFLSTPYLLSKLQIKQTKIHYGHNCKLGWQKNPRFNQLLTSGKFTIPLFHKSTTISFPSPPTDNIVAMMTVNLLCFSDWHSIPPSKTLRSFQTFLFINTS